MKYSLQFESILPEEELFLNSWKVSKPSTEFEILQNFLLINLLKSCRIDCRLVAWTIGREGYSENFKSITFLLRSIPSDSLYKYNPQFYFPGILEIETRCVINYSPSVLVYFLLILYCLRLAAPHVLVHIPFPCVSFALA